jgi:excisionase family DNA binding protein
MPGRPLKDYVKAAEYLGITERHLRRLTYEGRIPYVKLSPGRQGHVRFDPDDLDAFIRANREPARAS